MNPYVHPLVRLCNDHGSEARLESNADGAYVVRLALRHVLPGKRGTYRTIETVPATAEAVRTALGY